MNTTLKVPRMYKRNPEEGLWEIRESFLEEVISESKFKDSIGVGQALGSSSSICTSKHHQYQVASDYSQSPTI